MSFNPSNGISARNNPGQTMFTNLAGVDSQIADAQCRNELERAGIRVIFMEALRSQGEVRSATFGEHCMWGFKRAWYYWVANGPGVPPAAAEKFHKKWRTQVRVEGHCMSPSPLDYLHGFAVGSYHIDTQEGLAAFAELLSSIYREPEGVA